MEDNSKNLINNQIQEGRGLVLQACIVRIMKARKTFKHTDLVGRICYIVY